jgi:hypothetical protein
MAKGIGRRGFLGAGAGVAVLAAMAGGWAIMGHSDAQFIRDCIKHRLGYLDIAPGAVEAYAADVLKTDALKGPWTAANKFKMLSKIGYATANDLAVLTRRFGSLGIDFLSERIATQFLLSSDFFQNGMHLDRPVQYVAYADPYLRGCGNPVATLA